jgi:enoyl-CoA hydratase/carnithine racemase
VDRSTLTVDAENPPIGARRVGDVAVLTLQRGGRHNALSTAMLEQLDLRLGELAADAGETRPRALILAATGPSFSSGADTGEPCWHDVAARLGRRELFRRVLELLDSRPFPTIAAVHGYALGGGLELALACDLVVAAPDAVFGLPELAAGAVPGGGAVHSLARRAGRGLAADLLLTGRRITGAELHTAGGIDRLAQDATPLDCALDLAQGIAAHPGELLELAVGLLRRTTHLDRPDALAAEEGYWWRAAVRADRTQIARTP